MHNNLLKTTGNKIFNLQENLNGRSIHHKIIPTGCNFKNMLNKLIVVNGDYSQLKPWEKQSYKAYLIEEISGEILLSDKKEWKEIIRRHILEKRPIDLGASCVDIYLVAYVAETYGKGKERFFEYIKEKKFPKRIIQLKQYGKWEKVMVFSRYS